MPVFVGSSGDETELKSDRVGFAVSTANPSSASAGDSYFNSTDKQLKVYNGSDWDSVGAGGGTSDGLIASGTLSDGSTVVINTDGTVSHVAGSAAHMTGGTYAQFGSSVNYSLSAAFDSINNKIVIGYEDQANSGRGTAIVGTVSGTSITFGSPVVFESNTGPAVTMIATTYDSSNQKVVIAYRNWGIDYYGKAIVGTVSGTSISFGSAATFESAQTSHCAITYDSNSQKVVIAYSDIGNSYAGTAIVGTVSGTSISFGSATVFNSNRSDTISICYTENSKVVISHRDYDDNYYGKAIVGTVSGSSISFGSIVVFNSASTGDNTLAYDSTNQKVFLGYQDVSNASAGESKIGTVSGTSISFGSAINYESYANDLSAVYDSNAQKIIICYDTSSKGKALIGEISGTSITYGTAFEYSSTSNTYISAVYDSSNQKVVTSYVASSNGRSIVLTSANASTNLTSTNFLGFSDGAYTNGQTAKIQIAGSVDDAQSSLTPGTQYYVQTDGTLSTSAGNPSVLAGTAISSTKIIVRK